MKKYYTLIALVTFIMTGYSQINFESGYYVDNNGNKIECLIKNEDWIKNPTGFKYRLPSDEKVLIGDINSVQEFGVYEEFEYTRVTVDIDRSSNQFNRLSPVKAPIFNKEQLFLKVLVKGASSLFMYEEGTLIRFFYQREGADVEQLVHKSYRVDDMTVGQNERYKQQLLNYMICAKTDRASILGLKYRVKDLTGYFIEYNECQNGTYKTFIKNEDRDLFNLSIRLGIRSSEFTLENTSPLVYGKADFDSKVGISIGLEVEAVLPFNKNKWAFVIEPTYQSISGETESNFGANPQIVKLDYSSIDIPIGLRHYMFLNEKSKIFLNASVILSLFYNADIEFGNIINLESDKPSSKGNAVGLGYCFDNKYNVELRYTKIRNIIEQNTWNNDYKTISLIIGYTIF